MNIEYAIFDFNQINAFIPWLILVSVLYGLLFMSREPCMFFI